MTARAANITALHAAAFRHVAAYVITDQNGAKVATVALKFPTTGLRMWAYIRLDGLPMVRQSADGAGGFSDKTSAAVSGAIDKIKPYTFDGKDHAYGEALNAHRDAFRLASALMERRDWTLCLDGAGYRVLQAV